MKKLFLFLFVFINVIFIIKYTSRLNILSPYLFGILYSFAVVFFLFLYSFPLKKEKTYNFIFYFLSVLFFALTIYINYKVDTYKLNVDRWSAMEVGIKSLLNGNYPYTAIDHMGGRTSNLPTLFFIGIPFYLIGNIGYLQSFAFLVFIGILFLSFSTYRERLLGLLLLIISPAYLWEIYVKSDLMSNFILVLFFIAFVYKKIYPKYKNNIYLLSFLSTSLVLSRLTAIIPLALLLFRKFYKSSTLDKLKFLSVALFTVILFFYVAFHNVESLVIFKHYNPFELQNRQLPFIVSLILVASSFILSFRINNYKIQIYYSVFLLFISVFLAFLLRIYKSGISESIFNSRFDISYFNIVLPFLIIAIVFGYNSNPNQFSKASDDNLY